MNCAWLSSGRRVSSDRLLIILGSPPFATPARNLPARSAPAHASALAALALWCAALWCAALRSARLLAAAQHPIGHFLLRVGEAVVQRLQGRHEPLHSVCLRLAELREALHLFDRVRLARWRLLHQRIQLLRVVAHD